MDAQKSSQDPGQNQGQNNAKPTYFIGVDVGTGSVRAGLFSSSGKRVAYSEKAILKWTNNGFSEGSFEQSTEDIWGAVVFTVKVVFNYVIIFQCDLHISTWCLLKSSECNQYYDFV